MSVKSTWAVALVGISMGLGMAAPARAQGSDLLGALLGGAGGAVAGAQFGHGKGRLVGTAVGTLAGAVIGQSVGRSLDRGDAAYYGTRIDDDDYYGRPRYHRPHRRVIYAQPVYAQPMYPPPVYAEPVYAEPVYAAPPPPAYYPPPQPVSASSTGYCREYQAPITVGGRRVAGFGQACMQADGSWKLGPLQPEQ